jgi:hypothetical protein
LITLWPGKEVGYVGNAPLANHGEIQVDLPQMNADTLTGTMSTLMGLMASSNSPEIIVTAVPDTRRGGSGMLDGGGLSINKIRPYG